MLFDIFTNLTHNFYDKKKYCGEYPMNYENIKYLVFDVESVPDAKLIKMVKYPDRDIDELSAVKLFQDEVLEITDGKSSFIPVTFQYPVSICVAKVHDDFTISDIICLDEPRFRTGEMVRLFWHGVEDLYNHSSLITFNGRGFDIPLLELMAFRYGYKAKRHFKDKFAGRFRFGTKHIDLQDWLTNYNAIKLNGGLNLLAKIMGKPGKTTIKGDEVYEMFLSGKIREINDYCIHDVLDTYFVFLRTRVLLGELSIEKEQKIVSGAKNFIEERSDESPAMRSYLDNWGNWSPWPVEG